MLTHFHVINWKLFYHPFQILPCTSRFIRKNVAKTIPLNLHLSEINLAFHCRNKFWDRNKYWVFQSTISFYLVFFFMKYFGNINDYLRLSKGGKGVKIWLVYFRWWLLSYMKWNDMWNVQCRTCTRQDNHLFKPNILLFETKINFCVKKC